MRGFDRGSAAKEQHGADHAQVQQHGRGGIHPETVERIQYAAQQRHQADQRQIGEGDAGQRDGQVELGRAAIGKTAGHCPDHRRGQHHHEAGEQDQHREQDRQYLPGKGDRRRLATARRVPVPFRHRPVEHRHEHGGKGAFGEQGAKQVGQAPGDQKGVRRQPRAQKARDQHVAHHTQYPADQRQPADGGGGFQQAHDNISSTRSPPIARGGRL